MARATKKKIIEEKVMDEVSTHEEVVTAEFQEILQLKKLMLNGYSLLLLENIF